MDKLYKDKGYMKLSLKVLEDNLDDLKGWNKAHENIIQQDLDELLYILNLIKKSILAKT